MSVSLTGRDAAAVSSQRPPPVKDRTWRIERQNISFEFINMSAAIDASYFHFWSIKKSLLHSTEAKSVEKRKRCVAHLRRYVLRHERERVCLREL